MIDAAVPATQEHPPRDGRDRPRWRRWAGDICTFALLLATVLGLQWYGGAFEAEFYGGDEAGHYVTGLMVHDYLHQSDLTHPMRFAEDYYLHYPKVAIGHWPPLFYVVQAAHYSVFGVSRASVLLCMALIAATFGTTVCRIVSAEHGALLGVSMGFLAVCLPEVQGSAAMVMSDILLALLAVWATLWYAKYLESGTYRHAAAFGLLASLAILTKGNGLLLSLVPPLAVVLAGRYRLFLRWSFWLPGLVVIVLCGPWYYLTAGMFGDGFQSAGPSLAFTLKALVRLPAVLVRMTGAILFGAAVFGLGVRLMRREKLDEKRVALLALLIATVAFHALVPAGTGARFMFSAIPAFVLFLADAAVWIRARVSPRGSRLMLYNAIAVAAIFLAFAFETFCVPAKAWYGYRDVADAILRQPESAQYPVLVCTDCAGEGMFISEIAQAEQRPGHVILRASKTLASADWLGRGYRLRFDSPEAISDWLEEVPVAAVVIDESAAESERREHHRLLSAAVSANPDKWSCVGRYDVVRQGVSYPKSIAVYRQEGCQGNPAAKIRIPMQGSLHRDLELPLDGSR